MQRAGGQLAQQLAKPEAVFYVVDAFGRTISLTYNQAKTLLSSQQKAAAPRLPHRFRGNPVGRDYYHDARSNSDDSNVAPSGLHPHPSSLPQQRPYTGHHHHPNYATHTPTISHPIDGQIHHGEEKTNSTDETGNPVALSTVGTVPPPSQSLAPSAMAKSLNANEFIPRGSSHSHPHPHPHLHHQHAYSHHPHHASPYLHRPHHNQAHPGSSAVSNNKTGTSFPGSPNVQVRYNSAMPSHSTDPSSLPPLPPMFLGGSGAGVPNTNGGVIPSNNGEGNIPLPLANAYDKLMNRPGSRNAVAAATAAATLDYMYQQHQLQLQQQQHHQQQQTNPPQAIDESSSSCEPVTNPDDVDVVIYHGGCMDGMGACAAAYMRLGNRAVYIPGRFQMEPPDVTGKSVVLLDFTYPLSQMNKMKEQAKRLTILDHHDSALEELKTFQQNLKNIDLSRSGATLAWRFFHPGTPIPLLIQYIEDRDLWKNVLPGSREVSHALWNLEMSPMNYANLCTQGLQGILSLRKSGEKAVQNIDLLVGALSKTARVATFKKTGHRVLIVNAGVQRSELGGYLSTSRECDFVMLWSYDSLRGAPLCSLRRSDHYRTEDGVLKRRQNPPDLAAIARMYEGGGHHKASSFLITSGDIGSLLEPTTLDTIPLTLRGLVDGTHTDSNSNNNNNNNSHTNEGIIDPVLSGQAAPSDVGFNLPQFQLDPTALVTDHAGKLMSTHLSPSETQTAAIEALEIVYTNYYNMMMSSERNGNNYYGLAHPNENRSEELAKRKEEVVTIINGSCLRQYHATPTSTQTSSTESSTTSSTTTPTTSTPASEETSSSSSSSPLSSSITHGSASS